MFAFGIAQEVLIRLSLDVGLLHLAVLALLTVVDLTVELVELVGFVHNLLPVLLLLAQLVVGLLQLLVRELLNLLRRHASALGLATAGHGARQLDQLTSECDNPVALLEVVCRVSGHVDILAHERVSQRKIECIGEFLFVRPQQIVKALRVLRSLELHCAIGPNLDCDLVQSYEGGTTETILTEEVHTLLCIVQGFYNDEVQVAAAG